MKFLPNCYVRRLSCDSKQRDAGVIKLQGLDHTVDRFIAQIRHSMLLVSHSRTEQTNSSNWYNHKTLSQPPIEGYVGERNEATQTNCAHYAARGSHKTDARITLHGVAIITPSRPPIPPAVKKDQQLSIYRRWQRHIMSSSRKNHQPLMIKPPIHRLTDCM